MFQVSKYVVVVISICLPCLIKIPSRGEKTRGGIPQWTPPKWEWGHSSVWGVLCKGIAGGQRAPLPN